MYISFEDISETVKEGVNIASMMNIYFDWHIYIWPDNSTGESQSMPISTTNIYKMAACRANIMIAIKYEVTWAFH